MKLRNTNPMGQVDVPVLGRQGEPFGEHGSGCLEPGEVFEVPDALGRKLLEQSDNYAPVKAPKPKAPRKPRAPKPPAAPAAAPTVDEKG